MTKNEWREAMQAKLAGTEECERMIAYYEEMIDDRIEMGMDEESAVGALGDIDALTKDYIPRLPALSPSREQERYGAFSEVRIHLKNADCDILRDALPTGTYGVFTTARPEAFEWSIENDILEIREKALPRRHLFGFENIQATLRLSCEGLQKLIADDMGGDLHITNIEAAALIALSGASGDICVEAARCGDRIEVRTRSGDIQLNDVRAQSDIKGESVSGDIEIRLCAAERIQARTTSGDVDIRRCAGGSAALSSVSGDIDAADSDWTNDMAVDTKSGDIQIDRASAERIRFNTASGDIHALLPLCEQGYRLDAHSVSGDVRFDLPDGGDDSRSIHARSVSGDIFIRAQN